MRHKHASTTGSPPNDLQNEILAHMIGYQGYDYAAAAAAAGMKYGTMDDALAAVSYKLLDTTFSERVTHWHRRREKDEAMRDAVMQECAEVNHAFVVYGLTQIYRRAMDTGDLALARQTLVDLGKIRGMFTDKTVNENQNIDMIGEKSESDADRVLSECEDDDGTVH